jgi:hypothetical protein
MRAPGAAAGAGASGAGPDRLTTARQTGGVALMLEEVRGA